MMSAARKSEANFIKNQNINERPPANYEPAIPEQQTGQAEVLSSRV
jgi:hypothetical protein